MNSNSKVMCPSVFIPRALTIGAAEGDSSRNFTALPGYFDHFVSAVVGNAWRGWRGDLVAENHGSRESRK